MRTSFVSIFIPAVAVVPTTPRGIVRSSVRVIAVARLGNGALAVAAVGSSAVISRTARKTRAAVRFGPAGSGTVDVPACAVVPTTPRGIVRSSVGIAAITGFGNRTLAVTAVTGPTLITGRGASAIVRFGPTGSRTVDVVTSGVIASAASGCRRTARETRVRTGVIAVFVPALRGRVIGFLAARAVLIAGVGATALIPRRRTVDRGRRLVPTLRGRVIGFLAARAVLIAGVGATALIPRRRTVDRGRRFVPAVAVVPTTPRGIIRSSVRVIAVARLGNGALAVAAVTGPALITSRRASTVVRFGPTGSGTVDVPACAIIPAAPIGIGGVPVRIGTVIRCRPRARAVAAVGSSAVIPRTARKTRAAIRFGPTVGSAVDIVARAVVPAAPVAVRLTAAAPVVLGARAVAAVGGAAFVACAARAGAVAVAGIGGVVIAFVAVPAGVRELTARERAGRITILRVGAGGAVAV